MWAHRTSLIKLGTHSCPSCWDMAFFWHTLPANCYCFVFSMFECVATISSWESFLNDWRWLLLKRKMFYSTSFSPPHPPAVGVTGLPVGGPTGLGWMLGEARYKDSSHDQLGWLGLFTWTPYLLYQALPDRRITSPPTPSARPTLQDQTSKLPHLARLYHIWPDFTWVHVVLEFHGHSQVCL